MNRSPCVIFTQLSESARSQVFCCPPPDNERDALLLIRRKSRKTAEKKITSCQLAAHMNKTYWDRIGSRKVDES